MSFRRDLLSPNHALHLTPLRVRLNPTVMRRVRQKTVETEMAHRKRTEARKQASDSTVGGVQGVGIHISLSFDSLATWNQLTLELPPRGIFIQMW